MNFSFETIVLWAVPVVFAITLHEASHGYIAKMFGDRTAELAGRVTLNPLKHIDLIGTILVPGALVALAVLTKAPLFIFGWAKPVPVNHANLRRPKRDMIWVAGAGPLANFFMAFLWVLLLKATGPSGAWASDGLYQMGQIGVSVNLMLMALNLLPIPPLDGGRIAVGILPNAAGYALSRVEPYGFMIILVLLAVRLLDDLMMPLVRGGQFLLRALTGS